MLTRVPSIDRSLPPDLAPHKLPDLLLLPASKSFHLLGDLIVCVRLGGTFSSYWVDKRASQAHLVAVSSGLYEEHGCRAMSALKGKMQWRVA